MDDRRHIESYMRSRIYTMQQYDWWQAGIAAGTAPSEWETVKYGRDTALGWLDYGSLGMAEAIGQGFDAMYRLGYADIRDSIVYASDSRRSVTATSQTDVYSLTVVNNSSNVFDVLDWIARAPLTQDQKRLVVLFSLGWTLAEAANDLGLPDTSVRRWFKTALPILKGQIITGKILTMKRKRHASYCELLINHYGSCARRITTNGR
jgi:hypothetical protein